MPIFDGSKAIIEASLSYLFFDLPTEPAKLLTEVEKIKATFDPAHESKEESHAQLHTFIHSPQFFYKLEEQNVNPLTKEKVNLTYGEVQLAILEYVTQQIEQAAQNASIHLTDLRWNKKELAMLLIQQPNFAATFTSLKSPTINNDIHPYELYFPNKIFTAILEPDYNYQQVMLHLRIKLQPNEITEITSFELFPDDLDEDPLDDGEAFDDFMYHLVEVEAPPVAEKKAIKFILKNLFPQQEARDATFYAKRLLTIPFYYSLVKNDKKQFDAFKYINAQQAIALSSSIAIELIRSKKCTLEQAKSLASHVRSVIAIPFYYHCIIEGTVKLENLQTITLQQSKILILPNVIQLLERNVLTLAQAKMLSIETLPLLTTEFYRDYFFQHPGELWAIQHINAEQGQKLLHPLVMQLLSQRIISLIQAKNLDNMLIEKLETNPLLLHLVSKEIITLQNVRTIWPVYESHYLNKKIVLEKVNQWNINDLKSLLREFFMLASHGLLYGWDLVTLVTNDFYFSKEQIKLENNKISLLQPICLSAHSVVESFIKINLRNRLQNIIMGIPNFQPDQQVDQLQLIIKTCEQFKKSFKVISNEVLEKHIDSYLEGGNKPWIDMFVKSIIPLGQITINEVWGHILAKRMLAIYHNVPYKIQNTLDTISQIENSLYELPQEKCDINLTRQWAIKFFLQDVKHHLLENSAGRFNLYEKIIHEIEKAEQIDSSSLESKADPTQLKVWPKALFTIENMMQTTPFPPESMASTPKAERDLKRPKYSSRLISTPHFFKIIKEIAQLENVSPIPPPAPPIQTSTGKLVVRLCKV